MNQDIIDNIIKYAGSENVLLNEPMSKHTTFRVGGNADAYVFVDDEEKAVSLIRLLSCYNKNSCLDNNQEIIPYFIIGNGSNLLVSDNGYRGVIIEIGKGFNEILIDDNYLTVKAGAPIIKVANECLNNSLTGLEFASGIPGTVGGAVVMNAGAYGGEIKDVIETVKLYDILEDKIVIKKRDEMDFSYRHSIVKDRPYVVLEVVFKLEKGNKDEIKAVMDELREKRVTKQPLEYPSAGSTFKRPEGYFAGKLIEDSGLKGYSVGGAQVSEKHSGFVINRNNGTASDVYRLIQDVKNKVYTDSGVKLCEEVILLGDF